MVLKPQAKLFLNFNVFVLIIFHNPLFSTGEEFPQIIDRSPYKINEELGSKAALHYGDIILSPKQLKLRRFNTKYSKGVIKHIAIKEKANNRWPNNEVPYIFSDKYTDAQKRKIIDAFKTLETNSCFRFVPKSSLHRDYLFIDRLDGCFSFVGKIGGRQLDKFIQIQYHNVDPEKLINFEKIPLPDVDLYHDYDYNSIMHYDATAFGKMDPITLRPMITMVPVKTGVRLMDNLVLTRLDAQKLNILGSCGTHQTRPPPIPEDYLLEEPLTTNQINTNSIVDEAEPRSETKIKVTKISDPAHKLVCKDRSLECDNFKKKGFCSNFRYKTLMKVHCRNSCQFCGQPHSDENTNSAFNEIPSDYRI
ncbi:astacin (Peptidase family m12A) domain-containing protein [Ditylenchus destructor]|uniref:Astacin (Peptidase family m12A) domain-containing protein n=1 Tax=Ditylenchus destructor TaxID=166010 RepID=A0AAD4MM39_9BILA|nr:astacin (Peptidase family m12A) domain-containing protein [Ditylenchus destructor]